MEYYNLKLEYRNNYSINYYTNSLIIMISTYYELDNSLATNIVKNSISNTNSPIEFLKNIKKSIPL